METILIGAVVTLVLEVAKVLHKRFVNPQIEGAVIIVAGFLVSLIAAAVLKTVPQHMVSETLQIWASAVATYELVYTRVIAPVLAKLISSDNA